MASRQTRGNIPISHVHLLRCATLKRGYLTKAQALNVAESMMENGEVYPGCHITPYLCDACREWHVANRVIVKVR